MPALEARCAVSCLRRSSWVPAPTLSGPYVCGRASARSFTAYINRLCTVWSWYVQLEAFNRLPAVHAVTAGASLPDDSLILLHWAMAAAPTRLRRLTDASATLVPACYPPGHYLYPNHEFVVDLAPDPLFDRLAEQHGTTSACCGPHSCTGGA